MRRGKDDEEIKGPMFPRLHVNDTEKGGPRAPPRNKMALYEQLSIPSQRFNSGVLPLKPSNSKSLVPPSSSSQGSSLERNMRLPSSVSPSTATKLAEKFHTREDGGVSINAPLARLEQRKKVSDEDDFMVPVFVNSDTGQQLNKTKNGFDRENWTPLSTSYTRNQKKLQKFLDKDPNQSSSSGVNLRTEIRDRRGQSSKACTSCECSVKTAVDLSAREKVNGCAKEASVSPGQDFGEHPGSRLSSSHENDGCSLQKVQAGRQSADNGCLDGADLMRDISEGILRLKRSMAYSEGTYSIPDETNNDKTCDSIQWANGDKSNDVSDSFMLDSISGLDISPDDVVGIIGQKHFWKARRAIANQQRAFAVQVFELHRLIKVQKLIARSPHLLLEDTTYLGKLSFKCSPPKKLLPEFVLKPLPHTKHKDAAQKPSYKMECSAENAVGRTSLSSVKNGSQPSNFGPFLVNPPPASVNGDNQMSPWCFHQVPGHQWLVPVMSPSEGLIFKPYPGPGFMGSVCGGCGPFGQTPMTGNFMTSAYGIPASTQQGIGVLPGAPPVGHSYFPPYGRPVINPAISGSAVEQINQFGGPGSHANSGQLSGDAADFNMQHQSSFNLPSEKKDAVSPVMKFQPSTDTDLQGSTASSPGDRVQRIGASIAAEGKNSLPLFPTAPTIPEGVPQPCGTDQRRVIRVVPHNARSATESAGRIFQSIQKERKQV